MPNGESGPEGGQEGGPEMGPEETRTLSDADLIRGGACYEELEPGRKQLFVTPEQSRRILNEFEEGAWEEIEEDERDAYNPEKIFPLLEKLSPRFLAQISLSRSSPVFTVHESVLSRKESELGLFSVLWDFERRVGGIKEVVHDRKEGLLTITVSPYSKAEDGTWISKPTGKRSLSVSDNSLNKMGYRIPKK